MKKAFLWIKTSLAVAIIGCSLLIGGASFAKTLPLAATSPLTGLSFEDRPMLLPVERNFQMAMLAASSELGRSCGRIEAYAWQLHPSEQDRVNDIFKSTVDRLRVMGYTVTPGALKAATKDITVFTADLPTKHFVFLWSASDFGLVMNLCQTSAPIAPTHRPTSFSRSVQVYPVTPEEGALLDASRSVEDAKKSFSPKGKWSGTFSCKPKKYVGATLHISSLKNSGKFAGTFSFFPIKKNPSAEKGSFKVSGQYDKDSNLILINPGKWLDRPDGAFSTVMVGRFDPVKDTLGAYFEGVKGCTSFEAARGDSKDALKKETTKKKKASKKKTSKKKKASSKKKKSNKTKVSAKKTKKDKLYVPDVAPQGAAKDDKAYAGGGIDVGGSTSGAVPSGPTSSEAFPSSSLTDVPSVPLPKKAEPAPMPLQPQSSATPPSGTDVASQAASVPSEAGTPQEAGGEKTEGDVISEAPNAAH